MTGLVVPLAALVGLVVAPLLRQAIDQVPPRQPVLLRRTSNAEPLRPAELVPVRSWAVVEAAGTRVPLGSPDDHPEGNRPTTLRRWRAPAIDVATAVVFALLAHRIGWSAPLPAFLVFGAALVVVTVIDIDHYRIPDRVVFPTLAASTGLLALAAFSEGVPGALVAALAGAVAYFLFLFLFFVISPSGMGFGDVKLALVLGLHLGWVGSLSAVDGAWHYLGWAHGLRLVLLGGLFGSIAGTVVGLGVMTVRGRRAHFPFGPSLCLGALVAVLFSEQILW